MIQSVFFDTSSLLAGFISYTGASHRLLFACHIKKLMGFISEEVLAEANEHLHKTTLSSHEADLLLGWSNLILLPKPPAQAKTIFSSFVTDPNDLHVFAAASQIKNCVLLSLDKKHILSLQNKLARPRILSPSQFLAELLSKS